MAPRKLSEYIVQGIAKRVADQTWVADKPIPSVRAMAGLFGVARATMDAAVQQAVALGILDTKPRRGTRLTPDAIVHARRFLEQAGHHCRRARIAVLLPSRQPIADGPDPHGPLIGHIADLALKRNWVAEPVFWPIASQSGFPRFLVERRFDGAFCVLGRSPRLMTLHFMRERGFPLVVYNRKLHDLPLPAVLSDEYSAIQQLGRYLHSLGHRRMTLLASPPDTSDFFANRQVAGWFDFCRQQDLLAMWDEPVHILCHPDPAAAVRAYFRHHRPLPTAVVFDDPLHLHHFLPLVNDLGLQVPERISVAVCGSPPDDISLSGGLRVTCAQPDVHRLAECGLELLARMISGEPYPPPIRLPCSIVRTDSVASPPSG